MALHTATDGTHIYEARGERVADDVCPLSVRAREGETFGHYCGEIECGRRESCIWAPSHEEVARQVNRMRALNDGGK